MEHKSIIIFVFIAVGLVAFVPQSAYQNNYSSLSNLNIENQFKQWKNSFSIQFSPHEEIYRRGIFTKNYQNILKHNSNNQKKYELGLNQFSHFSSQQFSGLFLGITQKIQNQIRVDNSYLQMPKILQNVDWESLGKVSAVKNQGTCDAGYAFCTTSLVESFYMFQNKNVLLSEQQIVDCSADYTTFGCNSGSRIGTINFAKQKGLTLQSGYPYTGVKGNCKKASGQYIANFTLVQSNGCEQITNNLYKSPMTVAVNAQTWQSYKSGIYDGCTSTEVNHDTYLIGVTTQYWRVKNSWGNRWGQYGFIRLKLGNTCGICEKTGFSFK